MTTLAQAAQNFAEGIAANPTPPAQAAQAYSEVIATNPAPPAQAAQVYLEVIVATAVAVTPTGVQVFVAT